MKTKVHDLKKPITELSKISFKTIGFMLVMISIFLSGCKKQEEVDYKQLLFDNLEVRNSQLIEGDIPIPEGVTADWEVDPEIEMIINGGSVLFKTKSDKPIDLLLIQLEGTNSYFQIVYDEDGQHSFARKEQEEELLERVVRMNLPLPTTTKGLPEKFTVNAKVVALVNLKLGNKIPSRNDLLSFSFSSWLREFNTKFEIIFPSTTFRCGTSTVTDIDGNVYNTVKIGSQCWLKQNLKTTKLNDGTLITKISETVGPSWNSYTKPAWRYYGDNSSNNNLYGKLYNWYAAYSDKLCPTGWRVPYSTDWQSLASYLGGKSIAGGKLKNTSAWATPNIGASNSSGFSALPGGIYQNDSQGLGSYAAFWGYGWIAQSSGALAFYASILLNDSQEYRDGYEIFRTDGLSCRCIKE